MAQRASGQPSPVWIYTTGEASPAKRPLAVLLDGQFWAESMPVWPRWPR
jgi:enterochelin esterase family protein